MEVTVSRDSRTRTSAPPVVAVRDSDGAWHVMRGVTPVAVLELGVWQFDGAADDDGVTDAPRWLVDILEEHAPADWRACRYEITGLMLSCPSSPTRDDSVLLAHMMDTIASERAARKALEERLAGSALPAKSMESEDTDGEDGEEDGAGPGAGADQQGQADGQRGGPRRKLKARG